MPPAGSTRRSCGGSTSRSTSCRPSAEQRWQIWAAHLPPDHDVGDRLLTDIARRCTLTGGAIRNAAVHATLLALDAEVPVDEAAVLAALRREYRRTGGTCPL